MSGAELVSCTQGVSSISLDPPVPELWLGRKKGACHDSCATWIDKKISSKHCCIAFDAARSSFVLHDHSTNGTFVNGTLVGKGKSTPLSPGDVISLCCTGESDKHFEQGTSIVFRFESSVSSSQTPAPEAAGGGVFSSLPSSPSRTSEDPKTPPVSRQSAAHGDSPSASSSSSSSSRPSPLTKKPTAGKIKLVSGASGTREFKKEGLSTPSDFVAMLKRPTMISMEKLCRTLSTADAEWIDTFSDLGAISALIDVIHTKISATRVGFTAQNRTITHLALKSIKKTINVSQNGLKSLLKDPKNLGTIALALDSDFIKTKTTAAKLLAAIGSLGPQQHTALLDAIEYFRRQKNERTRFLSLVNSLKTEDDVDFKIAVFRLINVLVSGGEIVDQRALIRKELKTLGLMDLLELLEMERNDDLKQQIALFREEMENDSKETIFNETDLSDPVAIAKSIAQRTSGKAFQTFLLIMQRLFQIPVSDTGNERWEIADEMLTAATASKNRGPQRALDIGTIRSNVVQKVRAKISSDSEEMRLLREEVQKLKIVLDNKQTEFLEDKNNLIDRHTKEVSDIKRDMEQQILKLSEKIESLEHENNVLKQNQLSPPSPSPSSSSIASEPLSSSAPPPPPPDAPAPPPPPPGMGGAPPPPPPFGMGARRTVDYDAQYPYKPSTQMKQLFWKRLPDPKCDETLWKDVDFGVVELDGPLIESSFGAKKKEKVVVDDEADLAKNKAEEEKKRFENMLDLKRSNNICIMLSQFKMSPIAIKNAILAMDEQILTTERLTQMIKNAPTAEEQEVLEAYKGDIGVLGKAEQFLIQILKVPRVTDRLKLLLFKQTFADRTTDLISNLSVLRDACNRVVSSEGLRKVLEIVLAIGNFLNYSPNKAPSRGFSVDFLTKLSSTKSTDNTTTILHFVAHMISQRQAHLLNVPKELEDVSIASKLPSQFFFQEINEISNALKHIKREVQKLTAEWAERHQSDPEAEQTENEDRFKASMLTFSLLAKERMEAVNAVADELRTSAKTMARYLGEADEKAVLDDLLSIVNVFLSDLQKAINDNERDETLKAQQERIARKKEESLERRKSKAQMTRPSKGGGLLDKALATIRPGMTMRGRPPPSLSDLESGSGSVVSSAVPGEQ